LPLAPLLAKTPAKRKARPPFFFGDIIGITKQKAVWMREHPHGENWQSRHDRRRKLYRCKSLDRTTGKAFFIHRGTAATLTAPRRRDRYGLATPAPAKSKAAKPEGLTAIHTLDK